MRGLLSLAASVLLVGSGQLTAMSDTTTKAVTAHAQVLSRTSLTVSSHVLQFMVPERGQAAVASIDFVAGIRSPMGAEVVLTVEAAAIDGVPPASRITFSSGGDGSLTGAMAPQPVVAARWMGSGRRSGRIAFALHGVAPGTYAIPVRFVLSAP